jgi:CDP-glucose 4,6-dehydratase
MEGLVMSPAFWRGKRVFVTGHTGFKGGWLVLWLESLGAKVAGYALPAPTEPSFCKLTGIDRTITCTTDDIRNLAALREHLKQFSAQIVFHLAAQSLVRPSYQDPVDTYSTNVMGTVNLLEAVRQCPGIRAVVVVTSDKCYENREWLWGYRENEPMGGHDPYSNSKGCAELVTAAFRNSFFHPDAYQRHNVALASGRAGNVVGGGDWAQDRLLPDVIRAMVEHKPVKIRNPDAIRPWQHVLEPLGGYLHLAERLFEHGPQFSGAWNFGPRDDDAMPVSRIVDAATRLWGEGAKWETDGGQHPHEAVYLKLDCSKAHSLLGWQPRLRVDKALEWTIEWYKAWRQRKDMRDISLKQISTYAEMQPE